MQQHHPFTLSLRNLNFERQQFPLWENITCDIQSGDVVEVRGENGSGKSTLLRVIAGLLEPLSGDVLWQNKLITKLRDEYYTHLHYVGHLNAVKMNLTVHENIQLQISLLKQKISSHEIDYIVQRVGLREHKHSLGSQLSAGLLRRLSLTKLLIVKHPLWILDEPSTSLDTHAQHLVENLIAEHIQQGGAAILATHHSLNYPVTQTLHLGKNSATAPSGNNW